MSRIGLRELRQWHRCRDVFRMMTSRPPGIFLFTLFSLVALAFVLAAVSLPIGMTIGMLGGASPEQAVGVAVETAKVIELLGASILLWTLLPASAYNGIKWAWDYAPGKDEYRPADFLVGLFVGPGAIALWLWLLSTASWLPGTGL